ncbi:uncharacterized protein N7500_001725 [Penicillium coprophilum]|uniref:uncharacterized protein n=1 Tax=Penicillium coprophilum TaxID=36646 RepID=UPI00238CAD80|nr:uncharacterized protein N7500_001725 [Penicillium coprophilum]KAJ5173794.1 hypothetical protein N7500_001725 [Penicillium coprophilum]
MAPLAFRFPRRKHTLSPWRYNDKSITDGTSMQSALSTPALFLHESMHMVNRAKDIKFTNPSNEKLEAAYGAVLTGSLALAAPDDSANNECKQSYVVWNCYANERPMVLLLVPSRPKPMDAASIILNMELTSR